MITSLEGRRFTAVSDIVGGEVGTETMFTYHEQDDKIWADYAGGSVRHGHLVGTRDGDRLDFRYAQLNIDGQTSTGHCVSALSILPTVGCGSTRRGSLALATARAQLSNWPDTASTTF